MAYLRMQGVSKKIGPEDVLRDVSLSVCLGQIVGLEGENGSGKTMAMRVACGLVRPDAGVVTIDGKRLWRDIEFPPSVGLLIEAPALFDAYSALENLKLLASIKGRTTMEQMQCTLERVGLASDGRKRVRKFSLGMRQRLGIAMALMEMPDLIILDEPTNALDEESVGQLKSILNQERSRGAAILVSSHDRDFLDEICDGVVQMKCGRTVMRGTER